MAAGWPLPYGLSSETPVESYNAVQGYNALAVRGSPAKAMLNCATLSA